MRCNWIKDLLYLGLHEMLSYFNESVSQDESPLLLYSLSTLKNFYLNHTPFFNLSQWNSNIGVTRQNLSHMTKQLQHPNANSVISAWAGMHFGFDLLRDFKFYLLGCWVQLELPLSQFAFGVPGDEISLRHKSDSNLPDQLVL